MANQATDEGMDYVISVLLKGGTPDTTLYIGLWVDVELPSRLSTGGAVPSGWTEMTAATGSYARIAIITTDWGANATQGEGRRTTLTAAKVFTGFTTGAAAQGYFLATHPSSQAGDTIIHFSTLDSGSPRTLATLSDELRITPRFQVDSVYV